MDANATHTPNSWILRMSEQALRVFAMGLVLTGHMLPAGAVAAQDDPPSPSFSAPPRPAASGLAPVAVEGQAPASDEEALPPQEVPENAEAPQTGVETPAPEPATQAPEPMPVETGEAGPGVESPAVEVPAEAVPAPATDSATEDAPAAESSVPAPAVEPSPVAPEAPSAEATPPEAPAPASQEAAPPALPVVRGGVTPGQAAAVESADPTKYQIGEWTMTIRPGPIPPKPIREYSAPVAYEGFPASQNNMSVPVNVNVNNLASQGWPWASPWSTPWANLNYWNSPTAAYLFQHPQPYWQLRQDFYHLRPFIRGL